MLAGGHYLAAQTGLMILEAGGNAIDARVAAGLTLNVVEPQMCCFTGVAPIMIYLGRERRLVTIDGLGTWPRRASCELLERIGGDCVPEGILQTVVPGAPDAWLTALELHGTMSFADAVSTAIRYARDGFVTDPMMALTIKRKLADFPPGTASAAIFCPNGRPPEAGEIFLQSDLARTLQFLVDEEKAASGRAGQPASRRCATPSTAMRCSRRIMRASAPRRYARIALVLRCRRPASCSRLYFSGWSGRTPRRRLGSARHFLRLRRRPAWKCVLGDAERQRHAQIAGRARNRPAALRPRHPIAS